MRMRPDTRCTLNVTAIALDLRNQIKNNERKLLVTRFTVYRLYPVQIFHRQPLLQTSAPFSFKQNRLSTLKQAVPKRASYFSQLS